MADVQDQREILGIERFDVLLIHDPPKIDPTLAPGGTINGLPGRSPGGPTPR